jgi:hypothetical protein
VHRKNSSLSRKFVSLFVSNAYFKELNPEELYLVGYKALQNSAGYLLHTGSLLGLYFDPEDGGKIFLRNVGYTALYLRR